MADASLAGELLAAVEYAARKHQDQRRKDGCTPYINHPIAVAMLLAQTGHVTDIATLQAALLHDTIEDTSATAQELRELFGPEVCHLVEEVTDNKRLPAPERKRLQIEHASALSPKAKLIKLADKICNLRDLSRTQPPDWPKQRKLDYIDWAERVVTGCRGTHQVLEQLFDKVCSEKRLELAEVA